jgi:hypothetical protein
LKRFLALLRLYQGILARKGVRVHGWPIAYFESVQNRFLPRRVLLRQSFR